MVGSRNIIVSVLREDIRTNPDDRLNESSEWQERYLEKNSGLSVGSGEWEIKNDAE